jgi:GGDEF domain-containing protein
LQATTADMGRAPVMMDPLTELPAFGLFQDRYRQAQARAKRSGAPCVLVRFDVNGVLGADGGAERPAAMRAVAERIKACVREADSLAVLGVGQFALLVGAAPGSPALGQVMERIAAAIEAARPAAAGRGLVQFNVAAIDDRPLAESLAVLDREGARTIGAPS